MFIIALMILETLQINVVWKCSSIYQGIYVELYIFYL